MVSAQCGKVDTIAAHRIRTFRSFSLIELDHTCPLIPIVRVIPNQMDSPSSERHVESLFDL